MKKIKVITAHRSDMQKLIDEFFDENKNAVYIDLKAASTNDLGYTLCYIIYKEEIGVQL